jgi:hypothetical protein
MPARFVTDRKALAKLKREPAYQQLLDDAAEAVKDQAERNTPIGETHDTIHRYVITKTPTTRRVGNVDPFFHLTEFGSVNNPPYAPLRKGVTSAGLRLEAAPRTGPIV